MTQQLLACILDSMPHEIENSAQVSPGESGAIAGRRLAVILQFLGPYATSLENQTVQGLPIQADQIACDIAHGSIELQLGFDAAVAEIDKVDPRLAEDMRQRIEKAKVHQSSDEQVH